MLSRYHAQMSVECIFCGIVNGSEDASIIYEDDLVVAFMDIQPVNPGHALVVPRAHASYLADTPEHIAAQLMRVATRLVSAIQDGPLRGEGTNLFLADGEAAGQEVFHVHLHVIPRFGGDNMTLRVDYDPPPNRSVLDEHAATIAYALQEKA